MTLPDSDPARALAQRLAEAEAAETALAKVMQIIARSAGDLDASIQAMLEGALELCAAQLGIIMLYDPEKGFRVGHMKGVSPAFAEFLEGAGWFHPDPGTAIGRAERTLAPVNIPDVLAEAFSREGESLRTATVELGGARSFLVVPMLSGDGLVGTFTIYRRELRPFTAEDAALVTRFADQCVVALENARLIHETRALSAELEEMNASLKARVDAQVAEMEKLSTLRRFLPAQVADLVLADEGEAMLASHRRKIAALFCDLRGFTAFSETAEPEEVMEVLAQFHERVGSVVSAHDGTITNRAGDSVMVVLNDPMPVDDPADAMVRLAHDLRSELMAACEQWARLGYTLGVGMGMATGYATLGLVGSPGQYDYTAVGTVVNMAARLCQEAAHGQVLATRKLVAECAAEPAHRDLGPCEIRGVSRPVGLSEIAPPA